MKKPLSPAASDALKSLAVPKPEQNRVAPPESAPAAGYSKTSISLFPADCDATDRIVDLLWQHCRVRATRSHALRLAVRFAADLISPEDLQTRHEDVQRDDRRFKSSRVSKDDDKV